MQVLSGTWAEGALFLRQVDSFLPLWVFGLLLFLPVCLLLLQLIVYFSWKLRQVEAHITRFPRDRGAPYRPQQASGHVWRRRSVG